MGNTENKQIDTQNFDKLLQTFKKSSEIEDYRFGHATLYKDQNSDKQYLLKEMITVTEDDFQRCIYQFEKKQTYQNPNLIQLIGFSSKLVNEFCGKSFRIFAIYEYIGQNLEQEIASRTKKFEPKKYFSELEITKLAFDCINVLAYLQKQKIPHGDIRLKNILFQHDQVQMIAKLSDHIQFKKNNAFMEMLSSSEFDSQSVYLSPAQLRALFHKALPEHNVYKSDIYSLGVTLIHAAGLESCDEAYDYAKCEVNEGILNSKIMLLKQRYSTSFISLLQRMTQSSESQRPDSQELKEYLENPKNQFFTHDSKDSRNSQQQIKQENKNTDEEIKYQSKQFTSKMNQSPILKNPLISSGMKQSMVMHGKKLVMDSDFGKIDGSVYDTEDRSDVNRFSIQKSYQQPSNFESNYQSKIDNSMAFLKNKYSSDKYNFDVQLENFESNQSESNNFQLQQLQVDVTKVNVKKVDNQFFKKQESPKKWEAQQLNSKKIDESFESEISFQENKVIPQVMITNDKFLKNDYNKPKQNDQVYKPIQFNQQTERFSIKNENSNRQSFRDFDSKQSNRQSTRSNMDNHGKVRVSEAFQNGSRYEGEKQYNKRNGNGKFYYADGGVYNGQWKDNQMHGYGILYYASGKPAYQGNWQNDKFQGRGILFNENPQPLTTSYNYKNFNNVDEHWSKFEGEFSDDFKHGYGELTLSNNEKFCGMFKEDQIDGRGEFNTNQGNTVKGLWQNNGLVKTD